MMIGRNGPQSQQKRILLRVPFLLFPHDADQTAQSAELVPQFESAADLIIAFVFNSPAGVCAMLLQMFQNGPRMEIRERPVNGIRQ